MRQVGATYDDRNTEQLKEQVLKTIRRGWIKQGAVTIEKIYENVDMDVCLNEIRNDILEFRNREDS